MNTTGNIFAKIRYKDGIREAATNDVVKCLDLLDDRIKGLMPEGIIDWIQSHVVPDWADDPITLDPYQIDPIAAQVRKGVEEIVIIAPEQFGKSTTYQGPLIYKMTYTKGPKLIIYEEKTKAGDVNRRTLQPMITAVPELARQLERPGHKPRKNGYDLVNCWVDFTGAGADITSNNYRDAYADEFATWPLTLEKKRAQLDNVRKRLRTWRNRGEGCLVICSSSKGTTDDCPVWGEYAGIMDENDNRTGQTSMGVWHLECLQCAGLIDSTVIDGTRDPKTGSVVGGLQWAKDANGVIVKDSIRLVCPHCGHAHAEAESKEMNARGRFVHQYPEITHRLGFVIGGLSNLRGLRWHQIAEKRMAVTASRDFELERTYHNSFRGVAMPVRSTRENERIDLLLEHCMEPLPTDERPQIMAVLASADTQESPWGWYWVVRGLDKNFSLHLLDCGFAQTKAELEQAVCVKTYPDNRGTMLKVKYAIVDQGGTNADDVKDLARRWGHVWQYKGSSRPASLYQQSRGKGQLKLLLCDADRLQVMLLRALYDQDDQTNNYFWLPPRTEVPRDEDPAFDYLTNLAAVRNLGGRNGSARQNWAAKAHERRDFFDCEKMLQVLLLKNKKQLEDMIANGGKEKMLKLSELQGKR